MNITKQQFEKLQAELESFLAEKFYYDVTNGLTEKIQELEQKLAVAVEALELYSDPWSKRNIIEEETSIPDFYTEADFGMFAREALAKIRGDGINVY